jgi:hypothetical protein
LERFAPTPLRKNEDFQTENLSKKPHSYQGRFQRFQFFLGESAMFTSASIMKLWDMACRFLLCVLWLAVYPTVSQASPQTSERGSGYEEVLGRINPQESDSIWEKGKKAFMDRMNRPYFRFNVASTATLVWLLFVLVVQRIIHRRAKDRMVDAIADALAQDARSREEARQAIKRYNDHIEACNRMIEERERLAAASSEEEDVESPKDKVERITQELTTSPVDKNEHRQELQQPVRPEARAVPIQRYLDRISELQGLISEERRKNREIERNRRNDRARETTSTNPATERSE